MPGRLRRVGPIGFLLLTLLLSSSAVLAAPAVYAATPTATVTPQTTTPGSTVTVSGAGFAASESVDVLVSGQSTPLAIANVSPSGAVLPTLVALPYRLAAGSQTLTLEGTSSHLKASVALTITAVTATLTVGSTTLNQGATTTLSGANWAPNEAVSLTLSGNAASLATIHADVNGKLSGSVTIPYNAAAGTHTLTATGASSGRMASATLSVQVVNAVLNASPGSTAPGGMTSLSGSNWMPGEAITITLSGIPTPLAVVNTDTSGALPATSVTIPYTASIGTVTLTATGAKSARTATASLTLTQVVPSLAVTPQQTNQGGLITISSSQFAPNEAVSVGLEGLSAPLATITTTAAGLIEPTGIAIPYNVMTGTYTLRLTGTLSQRTVTTTIQIAALTPALSLTNINGPVSPGTTLMVNGTGFGRQEQVTLALNGAALTTTPAVITTTNGSFSAQVSVPAANLLSGANALSAIGNQSRASAVMTVTGVLPIVSTLYFANASSMSGDQPSLPILNTNNQPAHVDLTFYYRSGAPRQVSLDVPARSRMTADLAALAGANQQFGIKLAADHTVTAQLSERRSGRDDFSLLGVPAPSTTWYLAEGYTGLTFHETLALLNPGSQPAQVHLRLLPLGGKAARTATVVVPANSTQLVDANALYPRSSLSVIATSSQPIVLTRQLTFSTNGYGITAKAGINTPATSWLFAEGTTTTRFQTFLTILNPNAQGTYVTATFYGPTGTAYGSRTVFVAGLSRANIKLNDFLHASGIATILTSSLPIVAERPEYFGSPNGHMVAGSDVFGRNGAGPAWAFPGGNTGDRSDFLLIYNPTATRAVVDVTYYGSDGSLATKQLTVSPLTRSTVDVARYFPGIPAQHGLVVRVANNSNVVVEETVFAPNYSALGSTEGFAS